MTAHSPRKTRSSYTSGLLSIAGGSSLPVAGPSHSASAPVRPAKSTTKKTIKTVSNAAPEPPINGRAKGKGKQKATDTEAGESISADPTRGRTATRDAPPPASTRQLRKRPGASEPDDPPPSAERESISQPPRKRRKIDDVGDPSVAASASAPVKVGRALRSKPRPPDEPPPPSDRTVGGKTTTAAGGRSPIKRIKLLVRRPAPTNLSHPAQRVPPPAFQWSVSAYLGSYIDIGDTFPVQPEFDGTLRNEEVAKLAEKEAALWEQVAAMKRAGEWFGSDLFDTIRVGGAAANTVAVTESDAAGDGVQDSAAAAPAGVNSRPGDVWATVVASVVAHGRRNRGYTASSGGSSKARKPRSAFLAGQVASKIQGHWDAEAAKLERGRVAEEKRIRGYAKNVMNLVIAEWKKAVFHIRELERLKLEAEELKRGHEHLDAILDQSGRILETQRGDFTRARSESSVGTGWDQEDDEEEESEDEDEDEGEEEGNEDPSGVDLVSEKDDDTQAMEEEDEDQNSAEVDNDALTNSRALLGDFPQTPGSIASSLPPSSSPADPRSPSRGPSVGGGDLAEEEDQGPDGLQPESASLQDRSTDEPEPLSTDPDEALALAERQSPAPSSKAVSSSCQSSAAHHDPTDVHVTDTGTVVDSAPAPNGTVAQREEEEEDTDSEEAQPREYEVPEYLRPYAAAPVQWDDTKRVTPPLLLRGVLRPYQQSGLEWLASLHSNHINGILADEMGLGKTIQTISLLAHLACDRGIWGPHLIIVPTSVLLNWEMEFKKFLPGFRILSYHGTAKRRKELRVGWNEKHHFNVCITSYTLASKDAVVFKRKAWYYMILDEAHMIKNFKSQRWSTLLSFRSFRRLLLTGTPLQNNLTELWALLQFLMSGQDFANLKEFGQWFSTPLEKAIEAGNALDEDTMQRVTRLHQVLRPHLLRRLKRDVEKELPSKYEHLVLCPLSKRQRFLYDEFMSRAQTREALDSGVYQKIANILMQLRKVCNHPDLFEVRPIVTSFAMERSAIADFEIKDLLVRRRLCQDMEETVNLDLLGLRFIDRQGSSLIAAQETRRLDGTTRLPLISEIPGPPPPKDTRTIACFRAYHAYEKRAASISRWAHIGYLNRLRCNSFPVYSSETLAIVQECHQPLLPLSAVDTHYFDAVYLVNSAIKSYATRADDMAGVLDCFAFVTPTVLHQASVKLQIAFPAPSLLQYDCGKLQQLTSLLREKKAGGHRVLIFTQMTKILDILEIFLNFHGYLYLRLDGATRVEDRQYITERFNADNRVFCFIASSRSGGVGINLTGADTVVFYDSDFNPQMDRQCEDRAHRIGQIRDVHIYRFVSQHTVEEAMLRKANQKRHLDDLVIQRGEFDWRTLFAEDEGDGDGDAMAMAKALGEFDDTEDARAAAVAAREAVQIEGQDRADFLDAEAEVPPGQIQVQELEEPEPEPEPEEEGGSAADYMIAFVQRDPDFFREWKL
ncbi:SNF2 family N-terminal domain-containing protein [Roridomyces roridus]|uniref:Helicase SWR1 n=1 Tax=Roridomyces roridus TaxID=1738132 RepID=A0AAD7CG82_9AGAR|nr:SNF2 family N-terminal domain-containing protein [Roridomyces roridus]